MSIYIDVYGEYLNVLGRGGGGSEGAAYVLLFAVFV